MGCNLHLNLSPMPLPAFPLRPATERPPSAEAPLCSASLVQPDRRALRPERLLSCRRHYKREPDMTFPFRVSGQTWASLCLSLPCPTVDPCIAARYQIRTGVSWSDERKQQIYDLACEFDFMILDDDAYFYLQFPPAPDADAPGLHGLGRSLLSMDTQGRVVRIDTFSKFLAPGLRVGWIAAPPLLQEKMARAPFAPRFATRPSPVPLLLPLVAVGDSAPIFPPC